MGRISKIAWTDATFNIVWGCTKVSPACDNCYAEKWDARFGESHWGPDAPRKLFGDKHWREPLKWNRQAAAEGKRLKVFCSSMADVFETNDQLDSERAKLWTLIDLTPNLIWLLLTKRPQNIKRMLPSHLVGAPNIWLGSTIESMDYMWRYDALLQTRAVVHFLSLEPLVAEVDPSEVLARPEIEGHTLDWAITGCESGDGARYTPVDWYRRQRDAFRRFGVPWFFKQAPRGLDGITHVQGSSSWVKLAAKAAHADGKLYSGIIEQPFLDNEQHVNFPRAA